MLVYPSAHRHGVVDEDIVHAIDHALVAAEDDAAKCLYIGPGRAGNLLEVVTVIRDDGEEVAVHAMPMRRGYEVLLRDLGDDDA